jgi:hypothetical protein
MNRHRPLRLVDNRPDLYAALRKSRPSLFERIGDALASPRFIYAYLGFYAGCLATVGLAMLWERVL